MPKCNECGTSKECMGGRNAHWSNWYCPKCDVEEDESIYAGSGTEENPWTDEKKEELSDAVDTLRKLDGWHIEYNPKPIPDRRFDWDYWHDDHDGENLLFGMAESESHAIEIIKEKEKELEMEEELIKKLFLTSWPGGFLIPVEILGENKNIKDGIYIRYENGGTDTTTNEFLFDYPDLSITK